MNLTDIIGKVVPNSEISQTGISLKATAGLRQLPQQSQDWLIDTVRRSLATSGFVVDPLETRVIDGREEAFFGWMTVAIAFKIHQTIFSAPQMKYFGALDMGGASKQIAFILREESCQIGNSDGCSEQCKADWMLRSQGFFPCSSISEILESQDTNFLVSRSIPGLGLRSAMDEIVSFHEYNSQTRTQEEPVLVEFVDTVNVGADMIASHPCLAKGEFLPGSIHDYEYILYGEGNFSKCLELVR